jgi:hypothetical protein
MEKGKARENGQGKMPKNTKKMGYFPNGFANFVIGLIGRCKH